MAVVGGVAVGVALLLALAGIGFFIHRRFVGTRGWAPQGLRRGTGVRTCFLRAMRSIGI